MDFKPGHGKPGPGRPRLTPELEDKKPFTKAYYLRLLNETLKYTKEELKEVYEDKTRPVIEVWLASIVAKGVSGGDTQRLEALITRAIGPVPKIIDATASIEGPVYNSQEVQKLSDEELKEKVVGLLQGEIIESNES